LIDGYEVDQLNQLHQLLMGADRFVDVGANRGLFSWMANEIMSAGQIVLIEANPQLCQKLQDEILAWRPGNQLTIVPAAAGEKEEVLNFGVGSDDTSRSNGFYKSSKIGFRL
jgi:FkbM family methyltransferase